MEVVLHPNKVLSTPTKPITEFGTPYMFDLVTEMVKTMYEKQGVGLAAPQIGLDMAMCVIDVTETMTSPKAFFNPKIISQQHEISSHEGCLSVPGAYADRPRYNLIEVEYQDLDGKLHIEAMSGLMAIAMQHEVDHLNGKLFLDCFGPVKKRLLIDKYKKHIKQLSRQKD